MVVHAHPGVRRGPASLRPQFRSVEAKGRRARLHLFTYTVGNALFWTLLGAVSVSADAWYWWLVVPFAAWTLVLALHLWQVFAR